MNSELINSVDASTGEIIGKWGQLFGTWDRWTPKKKLFGFSVHQEAAVGTTSGRMAYATGTSFHPGGEALVGEFGPEVIRLPRGAQVDNHFETRSKLNSNDRDEEMAELKRTIEEAKKPINLIVDGRTLGRILAPVVDKEINKNLNIDKSGKGGLVW